MAKGKKKSSGNEVTAVEHHRRILDDSPDPELIGEAIDDMLDWYYATKKKNGGSNTKREGGKVH